MATTFKRCAICTLPVPTEGDKICCGCFNRWQWRKCKEPGCGCTPVDKFLPINPQSKDTIYVIADDSDFVATGYCQKHRKPGTLPSGQESTISSF